jgi:hypothetical protein
MECEFVVGAEGQVLDAGGVGVPVEVFLDLALLFAGGGLVDGDLDEVVAAGHDLGHEGGELGGDVLVVEVLEHGELEDVFVEGDPVVHFAELDVADEVVDVFEAARVLLVVLVDGEDGGDAGLGRAAACGLVGAALGEAAELRGEGGALLDLGEVVGAGAADEGVDGASEGADGGGGDGAVVRPWRCAAHRRTGRRS